MLNKISGTLVLALVTLSAVLPVVPQSSRIEAKMIQKERGSLKKIKVVLSYDDSELSIRNKGRKSEIITIPFSGIKHANYTYSERVQIAEGIGASVLTLSTGYLVPALAIGTMFLTSKKKTHWLGIQSEDRSMVLELKKEDYRQMLLDLKTRGLNIEDLGKSESARK